MQRQFVRALVFCDYVVRALRSRDARFVRAGLGAGFVGDHMHHYKDDVPHEALVGRLPGVDQYCARISVVRAARRSIAEVGLWTVTTCGLECYERLSTEALRRHLRIHLTCELRDGPARGLHPPEAPSLLVHQRHVDGHPGQLD